MNEKNDKKKIKDVKLPLINSNRKNNIKPIKTSTNKNKDTSTLSILSQNSLKANSVKSSNLDKKPQNKEDIKSNTFNSAMNKNILRPNTNTNINKSKSKINNKTGDKINEIINDVNNSRNIKTKVNSNNINNMNSFNSSATSNPKELNQIQKEVTNRKKKYKFKIYKPLNPLLAPHEDMSFFKDNSSKEKFFNDIKNELPRMTKKDLDKIKNKRIKRLEREKKQMENSNRQIMNDIKGQNSIIKSREIVLSNILNSINDSRYKISQKNAQKILEEGGIIEAYKYLIKNLCKNGMPEGNVYDYCADFIKNFERVWQKIKFRMKIKEVEEHFKKKKEKLIKENENNSSNKVYKALEQREELRFIKKFDKSRSSLRIIKRYQIQGNEINKNNAMITNIGNNEKSSVNNNNISNKKEGNKSINLINELKSIKTLERKNTNKTSLSEQNLGNFNLLSKKNSLASNKVTFNIKLKKNEDEEKQNEKIKLNQEKEKEKQKKKVKEKSKEKKKDIKKENEKIENEINSKNPTIINSKNNEIKDKEIQKDKKKPAVKKDKKGKIKIYDNSGK